MTKKVLLAALLLTALMTGISSAQEKLEPVPEIDFLTWVPAKFMAYFETSNYIAEEWRKLGLKVNLNQANMPNPLLTLWFKEHKFDCVVSVLSGLPYRMEPDFFTYSQFNSKNTAPGDWNVGEWSNAEFDEIGAKQLGIYDPEKRKPLINKLQEIIDREQPESVVYYEIQNMGINTQRCDLDYVAAPDGLRSIWNLVGSRPRAVPRFSRSVGISDQQTWNPIAAMQSDDFEMLRLVYDQLVQIGPKGEAKMWAAEKVETIDEVTVDVTLRKGLKFSDGKPVTVDDVKFTYDFMKEWKSAYFLKYLAPIKNIDILDPHKLRFQLDKPFAPFIMNTLGQASPHHPQAHLGGRGAEAWTQQASGLPEHAGGGKRRLQDGVLERSRGVPAASQHGPFYGTEGGSALHRLRFARVEQQRPQEGRDRRQHPEPPAGGRERFINRQEYQDFQGTRQRIYEHPLPMQPADFQAHGFESGSQLRHPPGADHR